MGGKRAFIVGVGIGEHHMLEREGRMSCYFRHLKDLFAESGVSVTKENKKDVDAFLHEQVGVEYKHCPDAWSAIKKVTQGTERARLATALRKRFGVG